MSFCPASSMKAVRPASLRTVRPSVLQSGPASGESTVGSSTSSRMVKRSSTTSQPSATCPARVWRRAVVAHDAGQHHGAGHGDGHAEHQTGHEAATQQAEDGGPGQRGGGYLDERAADGDMPHGQQILEMEMQADAEHEQDDADLRALGSGGGIRHEARRIGADQHARQQVAHQRGEAQFLREESQHGGGRQTASQRQDEIDVMGHAHRSPRRPEGRLGRPCGLPGAKKKV